MRLKKTVLMLLAAVLLLAACAQQGGGGSQAGAYSFSTIEEVPAVEELSELPHEDIERFRRGLENISPSSCEDYYAGMIAEFLKDEQLIGFSEITLEQDDLTLSPGKNNKSLSDLIFRIDLQMDTTKVIDNCDIAQDVSSQLMEYLSQDDVYYRFKAERCIVTTYDVNGYMIQTAERGYRNVKETVFKEQSQTEYDAQSVAYSFGEKNPEFVLDRFGAVPDTNELYMEFYVQDSYFGWGQQENQQQVDGLETIYGDIREYVLSEAAVGLYIEENNLTTMTVVFRNGILDNTYRDGIVDSGYLTFHSEL